MQSEGSNASVIACTPSDTSPQANCPTDYVCYNKDANTNYCVAGTSKVAPVTQQSDISLHPATCASGVQVATKSSVSWGQCECLNNRGCASGQSCGPVTSSINQCYWDLPLPNNGKIGRKSGPLTISITVNSNDPNAVVASGKLYAKQGCDSNGNNCYSDNSKGAPATAIEFTFQNNNDWYDISYINGVNMPATMFPAMATNLDYDSSDPYRCMAAGGDSATLKNISKYQMEYNLPSNKKLQPFACTNDYSNTFNTKKLTGFNFVSPVSSPKKCTKYCGGGLVCGLTLDAVTHGGTDTTCGNRLGYWTYAQFCAANKGYYNATLGIACGTTVDYAYALCKNNSALKDQGPGRSCFNSTTTVGNETCCGYKKWTLPGRRALSQPMGVGDRAVTGVITTDWVNDILPAVKPIKEGCYLAYSFQFDDPYSTFTCATKSGNNAANYNIDLCATGDAGIDPPTPAQCKAQVPSGYKPTEFTVGIPAGITIVIDSCDNSGCNSPLNPTPPASPIFKTVTSGNGDYLITATNSKSNHTEICKFRIPSAACISAVNPSLMCKNWGLSTIGAWAGRNIAITAFK